MSISWVGAEYSILIASLFNHFNVLNQLLTFSQIDHQLEYRKDFLIISQAKIRPNGYNLFIDIYINRLNLYQSDFA